MSVRVAINGFGRIGRNVMRAARERADGFEIVAVNDLMSADMAANLLTYDSIHGRYPDDVAAQGDDLVVGGREVKVLSERDPAALGWGDLGVDIVVESTGFFTKRDDAAKHLQAGARKVIISAPATDPDEYALAFDVELVKRAHAPAPSGRAPRSGSSTPTRCRTRR